jgi:leucyl aminopeptidase
LTPKAAAAVSREFSERATLQGYNPYFYRQTTAPPFNLQTVNLANLPKTRETIRAAREGHILGQGMNLTRHMVDAPSNFKSPLWLSNIAKSLETTSKHGTMSVTIMQKADLQAEKMGMALSVAAGNRAEDADQIRMPIMVYTPKDGKYDKTILLVGKGIIFDTGGTNLKTGGDPKTGKTYIHGMQGDMAGAAAVVGAMKAIDELQLKNVRVVGVTPFTANRIGPNSTHPHDIVYARNGKAVEISNTDAEGRLILGDAIHYAGEKFNPDLIVDIATLTGGKVAALGEDNSVAVMGNDLALAKRVKTMITDDLGRTADTVELTDAHRQWVTKGGKGKADIYNSVGRAGFKKHAVLGKGVDYDPSKHGIQHAAQGGAFIREFLPNPKTPWVHLDIAGSEMAEVKHLGNDEEYATGIGVKDLYSIVKATTNGSLLSKKKP